eukprot:CAMPEP_0176395408 /NCGR_PEP_ID=MMETSP0126-20121128/43387_1 /TAXON_ID=141414 ORGANISM="Strombidinopsis acuminatum, Strain SPMC142" /NCGR_SAMPLE_ID=MMETSP0126 /ASSEMBLY_ACC=CAM_ASM_000229 /LENGTH=55 /DNA_ID=CAMNT_0017768273 /DNA_START=844 /DNA_END=1011 /DNA_ORIENTATION=+
MSSRIIQRNLNTSLEEINFSDHIVEEGYDFDAAEFVSFELEEGRTAEELATLGRQ